MTIRLESLKKDSLGLFKELLGSSDFGGCFCAVWTSYGSDWETRCADKSAPNFATTSSNILQGRHAGYFVYFDNKLVGWTGAGPKTSFPLLANKLGSRQSAFVDSTWSIGCIAIKSEFRGMGMADKIVDAVMELAKMNHATCLEAYPVRPFHEPRIYRGTEGLYLRQGFKESSFEIDGEHQVLLMTRGIRS